MLPAFRGFTVEKSDFTHRPLAKVLRVGPAYVNPPGRPSIWFRRSNQISPGKPRKAFTTSGSNWLPEPFSISPCASRSVLENEEGSSEIMASRVSATAKMRAPSGISSPLRPRG